MAKQVIKFWDKIIVVLLGVAGVFSGCGKETNCSCEGNSGIGLMYGMPSANFVVQGTVMNKANSKPIPNIRIVAEYSDTLHTDAKGNYYFRSYHQLDAVNGEENGGKFASKEITIKLTNSEKKQMEECNQKFGTFVKTQNIELKKK